MTQEFRTEKDSMGEFQVPTEVQYGASTARAVDNFPISNFFKKNPKSATNFEISDRNRS